MTGDESVHLKEDMVHCCLGVDIGHRLVEDKGCSHLVEGKVEDRTVAAEGEDMAHDDFVEGEVGKVGQEVDTTESYMNKQLQAVSI